MKYPGRRSHSDQHTSTAPREVTCPEWCIEDHSTSYDPRDPNALRHASVVHEVGDYKILLTQYNVVGEKIPFDPAAVVFDGETMSPEGAALVGAALIPAAPELRPALTPERVDYTDPDGSESFGLRFVDELGHDQALKSLSKADLARRDKEKGNRDARPSRPVRAIQREVKGAPPMA